MTDGLLNATYIGKNGEEMNFEEAYATLTPKERQGFEIRMTAGVVGAMVVFGGLVYVARMLHPLPVETTIEQNQAIIPSQIEQICETSTDTTFFNMGGKQYFIKDVEGTPTLTQYNK